MERSNDVVIPEFEKLLQYLKQRRAFDFTGYKRASLKRRVDKRMQLVEIDGYIDYIDYLEVHPDEFTYLFDMILINVTGFFRDLAAWTQLGEQILPPLLEARAPHEPIRVWSAACASGEEAYTITMVLAEAMGIEAFKQRVKIYATDVDEPALDKARQAGYTLREIEGVPEDLRDKYFEPNHHPFTFRKDLRRQVIFGRHDLVQDAPISRIDLMICRNTLMYFNAETQARILGRLHFALNDDGFLMLGKVEMLLGHGALFRPVEGKRRIFTKVARHSLRDRLGVIAEANNESPTAKTWGFSRQTESAFESSPLAQIVVDASGFLAMANERARALFDVQPSALGRPFQDIELSYRPVELRSAIEQVRAERRSTSIREARYYDGDQALVFDIELIPLFANAAMVGGVLLGFVDVTSYRHLQDELEATNRDLETAYEELQSTNEELETTNEELQSTVEELETTNEELQSTNEELETMNEELQSTNDELQSINDALRDRTHELNDVNAFLESILTSLRGGVVVLDRDLDVELWNFRIEELWGLREDETKGAHFLDLEMGLPVPELEKPIREALGGADASEVVLDARNRRGREIQCRVAVTPLRASEGGIRGVILLMEEVPDGASSPSRAGV